MRDLHNNINPKLGLAFAAISTATNTDGAIIDLQGFRAAEFLIMSGVITDGTYTPAILAGDASDLSDGVAATAAELLGAPADATFVAADDNAVKKIGYIGSKRYIQLRLVSTGVTSGGSLGAACVLGHPEFAPTANPPV